jgi:hypothetical protein
MPGPTQKIGISRRGRRGGELVTPAPARVPIAMGQVARWLGAATTTPTACCPAPAAPELAGNDPAHGGRYNPISTPVEPKTTVARGTSTER